MSFKLKLKNKQNFILAREISQENIPESGVVQAKTLIQYVSGSSTEGTEVKGVGT